MTPVDPPNPAKRPFVDERPTLRDTPDPHLPARAGVIIADDPTTLTGPYALGEVIGRGGMGEVLLAHDRRIGREIALKRLQSGAPGETEISQFLREARIQARLEHPAIAPVYELGRDTAGRPYFTMKRLAGTTLAEHVTDGRVTRQRLLRAFADVCRAVDFAHSRGVVHRDLKPANIVLGEFGEVYVLDWGIAHVLPTAAALVTADIDTLETTPAPQRIVGTPGYMAPEQLEDPKVAPAADVYSLGTILFEILTGEPLHPHGEDAIASTRAGTNVSPAMRRPERAIPPELDAACAVALAMAPAARPSARQLAALVQDYLDGDRDLDRRRALAAAHLAQAREAARDPQSQVLALRNAGRALALDPAGSDAAALVTKLMLAPPHDRPPELDARLRAVDAKFGRGSAVGAAYGLLAFFAFIPLLIWSGFTNPGLAVVIFGLDALLVAFIFRFRLRGQGGWPVFVVLIGLTVWAAICSRIMGPFIIGPSVLGMMAMGFLAQPDLMHRPVLVITLLLAAFLGPIALEGVDAIASTWSVSGGSIISKSSLIRLSGAPAMVILIMGNVVTIVISGLFSRALSASRRDALRLLEIHAWRLQQLVPAPAPTA